MTSTSPSALRHIAYEPWLRRYELVVHHGGAGVMSGVMYHCLRAGRPALVLPLEYDPFDHAAQLCAAAVAQRRRSPAALLAQLGDALVDTELGTRCAAWRRRLSAVDAPAAIAAEVAALLARRAVPLP